MFRGEKEDSFECDMNEKGVQQVVEEVVQDIVEDVVQYIAQNNEIYQEMETDETDISGASVFRMRITDEIWSICCESNFLIYYLDNSVENNNIKPAVTQKVDNFSPYFAKPQTLMEVGLYFSTCFPFYLCLYFLIIKYIRLTRITSCPRHP